VIGASTSHGARASQGEWRSALARSVVHGAAIAAIVILAASACGSLPRTYYDNGVSDEAYIEAARANPDAQAFLDQYPSAEIVVDRSARLAVDFLETRRAAGPANENWEGIRLRVFIDPETNEPEEAVIQCDSMMIGRDLRTVMAAYATTGQCP
jgi:hypothetical protein